MNIKRMRGRNHRGGSPGGSPRYHGGGVPMNRNHVFDSSGPEGRIRGTAQQLFERYLQLGRDAASTGDRVIAESYFQYAEHYFRILNAMTQAAQQAMTPPPVPLQRRDPEPDGDDSGRPLAAGIGEQPQAADHREIAISAAPPDTYTNGSEG